MARRKRSWSRNIALVLVTVLVLIPLLFVFCHEETSELTKEKLRRTEMELRAIKDGLKDNTSYRGEAVVLKKLVAISQCCSDQELAESLPVTNMTGGLGGLGNLVWDYTGVHFLMDLNRVEVVFFERLHPSRRDISAMLYSIGPAWHAMEKDAEPELDAQVRAITAAITKFDVPVMFISSGIWGVEPKANTVVNGDRLDMMKTIEKVTVPHGFPVRGDITRDLLHRTGSTKATSIGCHTLMMYQRLGQGAELADKTHNVIERLRDPRLHRSVKVAFGTLTKLTEFSWSNFMVNQNTMFSLFDAFPESQLVSQNAADVADGLSRAPERTQFFYNFNKWRAFMQDMDVYVGGKIHGTMMALGAGVPAVLLVADGRLAELAVRMEIPHVVVGEEPMLPEGNWTNELLADFLADHIVDGRAFDRNRARAAAFYREMLAEAGIPAHPFISLLAASKDGRTTV